MNGPCIQRIVLLSIHCSGKCHTQSMPYPKYAIPKVCHTQSMPYPKYAIPKVCHTQSMPYPKCQVDTLNTVALERVLARETTFLSVLVRLCVYVSGYLCSVYRA